MLRAQPELLWVIVRLLAGRLRATDEALADAVFLDVPARTAKRLLELAGDGERFALPVTQEELAAMVGASRERVNKAMSLFTRLGWLVVEGRNRYRILDRARRWRTGPRSERGDVSAARKSRARAQASAASSARWACRSGPWTKPCSASGVDHDLAVGAVRARRGAAPRCRRRG